MRQSLREALQFVADDFAGFPRLPIVLGSTFALAGYALMGPALAGPAFSLGLLAGLAWLAVDDHAPRL